MPEETAISFGISSGARFGRAGRGMRRVSVPSFDSSEYLAFHRPKLESFAESSAPWPLLNIFGALLRDWMPLIDEYHYCEYGHCHPHLCAHIRIQIRPRSRIHVLYTSSVNPCREFCHCPSTFRLCVCYGYLQYPHCYRPNPPLLCTCSPSPLCLESRSQTRHHSKLYTMKSMLHRKHTMRFIEPSCATMSREWRQ
jgi:hypothetical protein